MPSLTKAPALNMKQFNGYFGCPTCLHPGFYRHRCMLYPPHSCNLRTHSSFIRSAEEAESSGSVINGVRGKSVLQPCLDLVNGIPVDYMHCVLEGVARSLLHNWIGTTNHGQPYYLGRKLKEIDSLLLKQRPPHYFTRSPRSLAKHLAYWKVSETRTWLLYYALPLLSEFLPPLYLHHTSLLVTAVHIFLKQDISETQIAAAEAMIDTFCKLLPELYGEESCTANAHCLTHLAKYVRLWGPLWTHSAFGFKSMNGHLKHLFHSCNQVHDQLVFSVQVSQTLQRLHSHLAENEDERTLQFLSFCSNILPRKTMSRIASHTYIVGKTLVDSLSRDEYSAVSSQSVGTVGPAVEIFSRLYHNGSLYHSVAYRREQGKRNSSVCCYHDEDHNLMFGEIQKFCRTTRALVVVKQHCVTESSLLKRFGLPGRDVLQQYAQVDLLSSFIHEVSQPGTTIAIPIEQLKGLCVFIHLPHRSFDYVVLQPTSFEHH